MVPNSYEAEWNHAFGIAAAGRHGADEILVELYDKDVHKEDDYIGSARISVAGLMDRGDVPLVLPVMNEPSEDAIHKMGQAISSGVAQRPSKDVSFRSVLSCSTLLPIFCARPTWKSVSVEPGQTALTRTPCAASSHAKDRVKASCAALVASYKAMPLRPLMA